MNNNDIQVGLTEVYNSYLSSANFIPNWQDMDKSELCRQYLDKVKEASPDSDSYLAAIICRYWPKIPRLYKDSCFVASMQDCYDWVIEAILYALEKRKWEDPNSSIYNDLAGPDKAINRKIKCIRLNFLIAVNRDKRKLDINILSKDMIDEALSNNYDYEEPETSLQLNALETVEIGSTIKYLYEQKLYFLIFLYDALLNNAYYVDNKLNTKKLASILKKYDEHYIDIMSNEYNLNHDNLLICYKKGLENKTIQQISNQIDLGLNKLKELYYNMEI